MLTQHIPLFFFLSVLVIIFLPLAENKMTITESFVSLQSGDDPVKILQGKPVLLRLHLQITEKLHSCHCISR